MKVLNPLSASLTCRHCVIVLVILVCATHVINGQDLPELKRLDENDQQLRFEASKDLASLGSSIIPALIEKLKHGSTAGKAGAADTLRLMGLTATPAVPYLVEALSDPDWVVGNSASYALAGIGPPAIPALIQPLSSTNFDTRRGALQAIWSMAAGIEHKPNPALNQSSFSPVVPELIRLLKDPESQIRGQAAQVLGMLGEVATPAIPNLVELMKDHRMRGVGTAVPEALSGIGMPALPYLIAALNDPDESFRFDVAIALSKIGPSIIPAVGNALKSDDPHVRQGAAQALGSLRGSADEAIPLLINALKDPQEVVRNTAAYSLGNIEVSSKATAAANLVEALDDPSPSVRSAVAYALSKVHGDPRTVVPALRLKAHDSNTNVRSNVIAAICRNRSARFNAIGVVLEALNDHDEEVRNSAAYGLIQFGSDGRIAIPFLVKALTDPNINVRANSVASIAGIAISLADARQTDAITDLESAYEYLTQNDIGVRRDIVDKLEDIRRSIEFLKYARAATIEFRLRQFVASHPYLTLVTTFYVLLFSFNLLLLWKSPIQLLNIGTYFSSRGSYKLPEWAGGITIPISYILLFEFFHFHRRVIDSWINNHIEVAKANFADRPAVKARNIYIDVPVEVNGQTETTVNKSTAGRIFSNKLSYLLIWGEGGSGKTSLACRFSQWGMLGGNVDGQTNSLMLPVIIDADITSRTRSGTVLASISEQLRALINSTSTIDENFVRYLLKSKRLLVVIDGLSEMSEESREQIVTEIHTVPINTCIITSRVEDDLDGLSRETIKPLRLKANRLASFIEAYLASVRKRDLFDDNMLFDACRNLSSIVGQREITPLLVRSYIDQVIAQREGVVDANLPANIPELMLNYINVLDRKRMPGAPDIRSVHQAAETVAWQCLKTRLQPMPANRNDVLTALGGNESASMLLDYLEKNLRIIQHVGSAKNQIRFTLDPLSEYLAAIHIVNEYRGNSNQWRRLFELSDHISGSANTTKEFLLALLDCCVSGFPQTNIPKSVVSEISKRIGVI